MTIRYLIRLRNDRGFSPVDIVSVSEQIFGILRKPHRKMGNLRISSRSIEFDLFLEDLDKMDEIKKLLDEKWKVFNIKKLNGSQASDRSTILEEGRMLFGEERFWECHEVLEGLWLKTQDEEKTLLQGIILVCAALVHYQRNRSKICLSMLRNYRHKLKWKERYYHGIDIESLRADVDKILSTERVHLFNLQYHSKHSQ